MRVGRIDSPFRPQDRTDVARFYAVTTPVVAWNEAARQASAAQGKSLSENARIFALLSMAICDASIATFDTKYHYSFWRPVTAIRAGDLDGNRRTVADPDWIPLISTPAFPGYASGHASLSGAAREVLEQAFGEDGHTITLANPALPDIVLEYGAWKEITDDIDDARVYGDIHFRFDQEARPVRESTSARTSSRITCVPWMTTTSEVGRSRSPRVRRVGRVGPQRGPADTGRAVGPHDVSIQKAAGGVLAAKQAPHRPE
jgi:hypothetical protein